MLSVLIFFIILSILIIVHELGHFLVAKKNGVLVEEFGFGLPPRIFGVKIGETLYSLNWLPFGGFVKVLGEERHELDKKKLPKNLQDRAYIAKKPWQKVAILTAGVIANFALGWVIISYLFTQGVPVPSDHVIIEEVVKGSPAAASGIIKGDIVQDIVVDNTSHKIAKPEDLVSVVDKNRGREIVVTLARGGQPTTVNLVPREDPPKGEGALGITITTFQIKKYPWYQAPFFGLFESFKVTGLIVKALAQTAVSVITFQKVQVDVAGPVGIAKITQEAVKFGNLAVLELLGLLSLNLAVINILPFPALDGGRLFLVLYESATRRPVNPAIERRLNLVGFAGLITLIILVTINDIVKLIR